MCNLQQHNPYEHPITGIEREMERIELGWKAVQAQHISSQEMASSEAKEYRQKNDARKRWCKYIHIYRKNTNF
jgi:hypothetical protein